MTLTTTPPRPARTRAWASVDRDPVARPALDDPSPAAVRPFSPQPSGRLLRAFFAIPALVYRLGLGLIFGRRFLLLTHRGRRSGRIRRTVVEAMRFDPTTFESVVAAGWGDRTQWYRNIVASPALGIETGGRRYRPMQRILTPDEVHDELRRYVRVNPWAKGVMARLGLDLGDGTDFVDVGHLRGVAFRPDPELDPRYQRRLRRRTTRRAYDLLARVYDAIAEPFEADVRAAGLRLLDARPGETVVEFGAGTGHALAALGWMVGPGGRVIGVDLSPRMVERARRRLDLEGPGPWVTADVGDATDSGLPDGSVDGVFMAFVLESFAAADATEALAECRRLLGSSGRLVVAALDRTDHPTLSQRLYEALQRLFPGLIDCRPIPVIDTLEDAGFEVDARVERQVGGLAVALVRARPRTA